MLEETSENDGFSYISKSSFSSAIHQTELFQRTGLDVSASVSQTFEEVEARMYVATLHSSPPPQLNTVLLPCKLTPFSPSVNYDSIDVCTHSLIQTRLPNQLLETKIMQHTAWFSP